MSLNNVAVSVILFVLKIRKNMTFDNVADFIERINNRLKKEPKPLPIVVSDPDGIIPCHYVQILNVDNKKITYWSWGGSHSSNLSDESTGIAELIIVKNK